ncbi:MAG TPA: MMPL family transporter [Solirubrobacteraceae bacterium]|nr:MMPL family transporter [Solirubrobacteraceae bacterium]
MTPLTPANHLAARMGRWSATHRKTAILGWLAFVLTALVVGSLVGTEKLDPSTSTIGESGRADAVLADRFDKPLVERVLVEHPTLTADEPAFRHALATIDRRLASFDTVTAVREPVISEDGRSVLLELQLATSDMPQAQKDVHPILAAVASLQRAHPAFSIGQFGDASAGKQLEEAFAADLEKAAVFSLPITLGILVIAFGALVAAGLPLLLALSAVLATMGLLAIPSQFVPLDGNIDAIVLLIGLAVGVDYSLFYLKRAREERAAGRSEGAALEAAAATSGRAVLVSGLTVMIAMAGMFLTGERTFAGFALATILVVAVAVLGSLTVLPALLAWLGDRVEKARVPFLHRLRRSDGEPRLWGWLLGHVLGRPRLAALASGGALLALAGVALQLDTVVTGPDTYPKSVPVMATYAKMQAAFPGGPMPLAVVVEAEDVRAPAVTRGIETLRHAALATGRMNEPITVDVSPDSTVAVVSIPVEGAGTDEISYAALDALRNDVLPATLGEVAGTSYAVTGNTAASKDFDDLMASTSPLVVAFVLVFAFLLLLVTFRSLVIAVKAVLLNALSVAAAYGVLVLVFQRGLGQGLLGFDSTGGINPIVPLFLFVILFGLSMDYHVFILSRIREGYDRGLSTDAAVAQGIKATAGVVTSAAIVMVGVFAIFATLSMLFLKQFGVGLAAAVLIDATIVRAVLLPATMTLLGDWNWYLPRWLEWLPHDHEPPVHDPTPVAQPTS